MSSAQVREEIHSASDALAEYTGLVERLRASYEQLEQRARRIESELEQANAQLAAKVEELDRTTRHLNAILDALPVGVVVEDSRGRQTRRNPTAEKLLAGCGSAILEGAAELRAESFELNDGRRRHLRRSTSEILRAQADLLGRVHVIEDESEALELRARLARHDTLVALGEMAAEIAHEIRNPLNAVEGFANLLLRRMRRGVDCEETSTSYAQKIVQGVREVDAIITNLMTFASPQVLHPERLDPETLAREGIELATRGLTEERVEGYGFELDFAERDTWIRGDHIKLRQVFRNLIANAIEAMEGGGVVRIRGRWKEDSFHRITVEDEGPGIDPAIAPKLFRPFATGKAGGTGLGLALVHRILEAHGGSIELKESPRGACFSMRLPGEKGKERIDDREGTRRR